MYGKESVLATHKPQIIRSWVTDLLLMTFLLGFFYVLYLGMHPLFTPDEGRYSEVAREMIATHDYITPRLNGVAFLDKPILYYWLQVSAIKIFGLKEWALRFWPAFIAVLGCIMTYLAGRLLFTRRTGVLSAIMLATNPLYYGAAHYANLDLEVAVLISCTLFFSLFALQAVSNQRRTVFLLFAYLFSALAVLTKGLIGVAFPVMIVGSWILIFHQWKLLGKMRLLSGTCIFLVLTLPWYFLVQKANPQFFHFFFVTQQVERFLTQADFNNSTVAWFYLPIVGVGFLPWSLFLVQALIRLIQQIRKNFRQSRTQVFLLLWFLIVFIFFSFPKSKTVGYILPLFPVMALITGDYVSKYWEQPKSPGILFAILSFIIVCFFIIVVCVLVPHIKAMEIPQGIVAYLNDIAVIFLLGGVAAFYFLFKRNVKKLFACFTVIASAFLLILSISAPVLNQKTIKPLAMQLKSIITPQDEVVTFYRYYQDLPLYLERRITIVADWHAPDILHNDNWVRELWFGMPFQDTSAWLIGESAFWQRWNSRRRLFVLMNVHDYENFSKKTKIAYKLGEYNDVALISNKIS
ncbi:MAG: arnT 3 [Gammaproteobacteria bacterium]|jgi:4-amino-4-deoxy-L-arabinose transferase-like glycosyltransferase|nr:arnT 3 [Gammaproteobacteria bacterium]